MDLQRFYRHAQSARLDFTRFLNPHRAFHVLLGRHRTLLDHLFAVAAHQAALLIQLHQLYV